MRLIIVGGGPTGLTAALLAAEAGHNVTVLEQSHRLGGMAASITVSDQRVDLGSHRLHPTASDDVRGLLERLLGNDLQTRERNGRIRIGGRWVMFPLSPLDLARRLPPRFVASVALDTLLAPLRNERDDTYDEVVRAGLGPSVLRWFYGPYATKLWGRDPADLHGDVARRRIAVTSIRQLVQKLVRAKLDGPPTFLYPKRGYGQVVDALVTHAEQAGVEIITGAGVDRMAASAGGRAVTWNVGGEARNETVDRVFWTASPARLAEVLAVENGVERPAIPARGHRGVVLVFLTLDCDRYTKFDAHYFPELDVLAARVSEPKNYRDGDDPQGQTVLCAEIACDPGDETWTADTGALGKRVMASLAAAEVRAGAEPAVLAVHLERLPAVYPVIAADDMAAQQELLDWAHKVDGVTLLGRQGLVVADNLHHVMDMAFAAVACLDSTGWNEGSWREALRRFEDHVVED